MRPSKGNLNFHEESSTQAGSLTIFLLQHDCGVLCSVDSGLSIVGAPLSCATSDLLSHFFRQNHLDVFPGPFFL